MALHWPTFFTRLGSAIVFSVIMMVGLLWNIWASLALVSLIQVLCLREYFGLMAKLDADANRPAWLPLVIQIIALLMLWAVAWQLMEGLAFMPLLAVIPVVILLATTLSKKTALKAGLEALGGLLYIALPMMMLLAMRMQSLSIPLALVLMIWMNDTMAYLVGSFIGKTPFSPISPKKTWEGTAGGALLTIAGAAVWGYYSPYYTMVDWMVLALCAAVAGTAGDLLESKLKRMANIKDSGTMMPGHGGALDRFDSLLVATPFAFAWAYLLMPSLPLVVF